MIYEQLPRSRVIQGTVVGAIMLASIILAVMMPKVISSRIGLLLACVPIVILVSILFLHQPVLGLYALVVADFIVPFSIGTGTQTTLSTPVLLLIFLSALWIFGLIVNRQRQVYINSHAILPLISLVGVALIAFLNGQFPWYMFTKHAPLTAQLGGLALFGLSAFAFLVVGFQIQSIDGLKRLVFLFLGLGTIYILGDLFHSLGVVINRFIVPDVTGSLFWVWLVSLSFSQALINKSLRMVWRLALFSLAVGTLFVGLVQNSGWTSGWLPALVSVFVILWVAHPRFSILPGALLAGLVALRMDKITSLFMVGDNQYSLVTRLEAWTIMEKIVSVSPFLGLGPANYYWYTPLFPILGYSVSFNSHNNYVDLIAQTGLIGLACFIWFAWEVGRLGWQLKSKVNDGFQKAYVIGALGGLAGTLVAGMLGDWVIPFVYNIGFGGFRASMFGWIFLGGLIVVLRQSTTVENNSPLDS